MIYKKFALLILGIFLLNILSVNITSANSNFKYSGKDYTLKSKDLKITVTDVDTSTISGLRTNEGIMDVDIKHLKSANKKGVRLTIVCSDNNYKNVVDICNQDFYFDTSNKRIHYISNTPKSNIILQFAVGNFNGNSIGNEEGETIDYLLEKKVKLNHISKKPKSSTVRITSPRDGSKVYFGADFLLNWNLKSKGIVNILNCMPDKTGCSPIDGGNNFGSGRKGQIRIPVDSIISGNSLIKVENATNPSSFDFVEVVALPR